MALEEAREIEFHEDFERTLARMAELKRSITQIDLETTLLVAKIVKDGEERTAAMHDEYDPLLAAMWRYVDAHPELFDKAKDVTLPDVILTRTPSVRNTIVDLKGLIKALRSIGEGNLVKVEESVPLAPLKATKGVFDKVKKIAPNTIHSTKVWNFKLSFRPKDTKSESGGIPKPETHEIPQPM